MLRDNEAEYKEYRIKSLHEMLQLSGRPFINDKDFKQIVSKTGDIISYKELDTIVSLKKIDRKKTGYSFEDPEGVYYKQAWLKKVKK